MLVRREGLRKVGSMTGVIDPEKWATEHDLWYPTRFPPLYLRLAGSHYQVARNADGSFRSMERLCRDGHEFGWNQDGPSFCVHCGADRP
jgi:hypothetical protein